MNDTLITEARLKAFMGLPWPLSASTLMQITDEDLDNLAKPAAAEKDEYWKQLNAIVHRIEDGREVPR